MSRPASRLTPIPASDSGDGTVERERRWWWWIDLWLEPRWCALLTWVVLAFLMTWLQATYLSFLMIIRGVDYVFQTAGAHLAVAMPRPLRTLAVLSTSLVIGCWYQPVVLRAGVARWCIWMSATVVFGAAVFIFGSEYLKAMPWLWGSVTALPGLAIAGLRSRPWMSLVGGALTTLVNIFAERASPGLLAGSMWSIVYGAAMLYGTAPLPRQEMRMIR